MKQKIDLYREVLSLEPDSKVFLPLARLLDEDGQLDEAISVVRQGLQRHKDYLEGRLMLIDLLFKQGDYNVIEDELKGMTKILCKYDGFWSAWIESLAQNPDSRDAATALRFFNATMNGHNISWSAVLEQGLGSFFSKGGHQPVPFVLNKTESDDEAGQSKKNTSDRQLKAETDKTAKTTVEKTVSNDDQPAKEASGQPAGQSDKEQAQPVIEEAPSIIAAVAAEVTAAVEEEPAKPEVTQSSMAELVGVAASDFDINEDEGNDDDSAVVLTSMVNRDDSAPEPDAVDEEEGFDIDLDLNLDSNGDETFTLNTKSMAEVLEEQGDYAGARDIYVALRNEAKTPEEEADYDDRIAKVSAMIGIETEAQIEDVKADDDMGPGKDRLIGVLETLAQKLETKS